MNKIALVAGATGLVGKHIVNELINNEAYKKVVVLSRRELSRSHPKLEVVITDFDQLGKVSIRYKIDECFCALGTTQKKSGKAGILKVDYAYVLKLAELCERYAIPKFLVVSSQGANANSTFFYMRTKGQMEEAVKRAELPITYIIRPSLITGKREEFRFSEKMGSYLYKVLSPLMIGKLKKLRPVSALQIARCMISLAQKTEPGNRVIESDFIQQF